MVCGTNVRGDAGLVPVTGFSVARCTHQTGVSALPHGPHRRRSIHFRTVKRMPRPCSATA